MATIRDVAGLARVAPSTISGVMNGSLKVHPDTKRRIDEAINRLQYRPNAMARGLRTRQAPAWGLIVPSIDNPYYPAVARGIEDIACQNQFSLLVCNTDHDPGKESDYLKMLMTQASAVIITDTRVDQPSLERVVEEGIQLVLVNPPYDLPGAQVIRINYISGSTEAIDHLVRFGHRRIAYVTGPLNRWRFRERLCGYRIGLDAVGLPYDESLVIRGDLTVDGGHSACRELLNRSPRPTAIVFANDIMAIGGLSAVHDSGFIVPEDISIVGFDDIPLAGHVRPKLTTVYQPSYDLGRVVGQNLVTGHPQAAVLLDTRLVPRASTGRSRHT